MQHAISGIFNDSAGNMRLKIAGIYAVLIAANFGAWAWALVVFRNHPVFVVRPQLLRKEFVPENAAA